jgi:hypothetical protein
LVRACVTIYSITSIVSAPISQYGNQSARFIPRNNKESGSTIHSILSRYMRSPVRFPRWIYSESCMPPPLYMLSRGVGRGITFFHFNVYTVDPRTYHFVTFFFMYYGFDIPQILLVAYFTPPALQHAGTEEARWIDGLAGRLYVLDGTSDREQSLDGWMGGRGGLAFNTIPFSC